jgi:predicted RNA-binding protein with TRAM domain
MNESQTAAPVKVGETYDVSINAVGGKGDGIAKVKGFVLFVPGVKKGDYVKIKVTKVLANVGFAEIVQHVERPQGRFAQVTEEELHGMKPVEEEKHYEDTEDFGE